jgi:hypothetical protein
MQHPKRLARFGIELKNVAGPIDADKANELFALKALALGILIEVAAKVGPASQGFE